MDARTPSVPSLRSIQRTDISKDMLGEPLALMPSGEVAAFSVSQGGVGARKEAPFHIVEAYAPPP